MKTKNILSICAALAIVVILILGIYSAYKKTPPQHIETGINPPKGNVTAQVTIVEFSDFQCPACKTAQKTINEILKEYGGKVSFYYRNYPLSFHANSFIAAEAAEAANEQRKFWEYHDILFANQNNLDKESLKKYAKDLGLDTEKFNSELDSEKYKSAIEKDIADGNSLGVPGTPVFFINGRQVFGADKTKIKQIIEEELSK